MPVNSATLPPGSDMNGGRAGNSVAETAICLTRFRWMPVPDAQREGAVSGVGFGTILLLFGRRGGVSPTSVRRGAVFGALRSGDPALLAHSHR